MRGIVSVLCPAIASAIALGCSSAAADTFTPTRFDDPAPNKCKPRDCSLREALRAADKDPNHSTVRLGKGTYRIQIPPGSSDQATGDLDVFRAATIRGKGPTKTKVTGAGLDRVFDLDPTSGAELPAHTFRGLTITGGAAADNIGGGIRAFISKTKIVNVVITGNSAADGGGGIGAFRADITIKHSTISGNSAPVGGGILVPNGAVITNRLLLDSSTISGNTAEIGGGLSLDGFFVNSPNFDKAPAGTVFNSTVAGNQANVSGGGISAIQGANAEVDDSTIAYNGADADNSGGGDGGGVHESTSAFFQILGSIVANNTVGTSGGTGPECAGAFNGSHNVVSSPSTDCPNPTTVADAGIGTLADNGGPTQTIKLLFGSPAIGVLSSCPAKDQRGVARPSTGCDAGAYERNGP